MKGLISTLDMMNDEPNESRTMSHSFAGQKKRHGGCFGSNTPSGSGDAHVARTHEEREAAKIREMPLSSGLSMQIGMGNMEHSIDDGKNY